LFTMIVVLLLASRALAAVLPHNLASAYLLRAGLISATYVDASRSYGESAVASGRFAAYWGLGLLAGWQGREDEQQAQWTAFLDRSPARLPLLTVLWSGRDDLAALAVDRYPQLAITHFWLAESVAESEPERAISAYRQGLALDPEDGRRWFALAQIHRRLGQNEDAFVALVESCYNGDPGSNGCWGAGRMAEEEEDWAQALRFYRHSLWETAQQRADELERRLSPPSTPP
jgi:tetratricopeptide (TPR) repeat protein